MKQTYLLFLLSALALLLLSCTQMPLPKRQLAGFPGTKADIGNDRHTITLIIVDAYPYYYAQADKPVPCDIVVWDRYSHPYPIQQGDRRSEPQHEVFELGREPLRRECIVATIVVAETGERFHTRIDGEDYTFRIGSYDN